VTLAASKAAALAGTLDPSKVSGNFYLAYNIAGVCFGAGRGPLLPGQSPEAQDDRGRGGGGREGGGLTRASKG